MATAISVTPPVRPQRAPTIDPDLRPVERTTRPPAMAGAERAWRWDPEAWRAIAAADPLDATSALVALPAMNRAGDIAAIASVLRRIAPRLEEARSLPFTEAAAAMRDIGVCLGSIRRHGVEPVEAMPTLEVLLPALAARTGLPPRDNVLHYTMWNPRGPGMRRYTDWPDELALVDAVRRCGPQVYPTVSDLDAMWTLEPESPRFAELARRCRLRVERLVGFMLDVRRCVDPRVFAGELRPYFDPIRVGGVDYKGPGAVEMPLFLVDHLLWNADATDAELVEFKTTYVPDQLPSLRAIYRDRAGQPPLVERAIAALTTPDGSTPEAVAAAYDLHAMLKALLGFRAPHVAMARKAYPRGGGGYRKGSGGYAPTALRHIIKLNRAAERRLAHHLPAMHSENAR